MSPTHQDLSNDTTFSQIKSRVPVPLNYCMLGSNQLSQGLGIVPPVTLQAALFVTS